MKKCDKLLIEHSDSINNRLELVTKENRPFVSQLVLESLRHFVEHVCLKIYCEDNNLDLDDSYDNIVEAISHIRVHGQYRFIADFHKKHLQKSVSHSIPSVDYSETLLLLYWTPLLQIKDYLYKRFGISVINNVSKYPLDLDDTFYNYYKNIWQTISSMEFLIGDETSFYYVYKKKPIWVEGHLMYELTLGPANDYASRFDRIVVFTTIDVFDNYAIEAELHYEKTQCFDTSVNICILTDYKVSIRTYELKNLGRVFGLSESIQRKQKEFSYLMQYIKNNRMSLLDITEQGDLDYSIFENEIKTIAKDETPILNILARARKIVINNLPGKNVVRYFLAHLKNSVILSQLSKNNNLKASLLHIRNGSLNFEETPFAANLVGTGNPLSYVFDCIDDSDSECQLLARRIQEKSDKTGQLYVDSSSVYKGNDLDSIIRKYNNLLPSFEQRRLIEPFSDSVFIKANEDNTASILRFILNRTKQGIDGYTNLADNWLSTNSTNVLGSEKAKIIRNMFNKTTVYALYGAAGTGKSKTTSFLLDIFARAKRICLAATYPAVENMRRKINDSSVTYMTIDSFLSKKYLDTNWDIVVIDECSVVSNESMIRLLNKISFKAMLLTGDIYQLPSIEFGNWFHILPYIIPESCHAELTEQFRTTDNDLKELWTKVRGFDESIYEYLKRKEMTRCLDDSVFKYEEGQIILCYNYDGLYGINSINRYLQEKNPKPPVYWKQYIFKVNDPVIFTDTYRFQGIIYNNLKGIIRSITKEQGKITFEVEINNALSSLDFNNSEIEYVSSPRTEWTIVRFSVYEQKEDEEPQQMHVIPFTISYAVSIHKSQGLEYDFVKVIIANNVEELITHNVFYTAVTRAKKKLVIYWTPETAVKVLREFKQRFDAKDGLIIKNRFFRN